MANKKIKMSELRAFVRQVMNESKAVKKETKKPVAKIKLSEVRRLVRKQLQEVSVRPTTIGDLESNWQQYFPNASSEDEIQLITDTSEVEEIKNQIPNADGYDGFFVLVDGGDYDTVYGFEGSVPNLGKLVTKLV
jgi:hypothetical protein